MAKYIWPNILYIWQAQASAAETKCVFSQKIDYFKLLCKMFQMDWE